MTALESRGDLHAFLLGLLPRAKYSTKTARVGRKRFLHEHVDALPDGIFDVDWSNVRARGAEGDVAGPEDIDRLAIRIEAKELAVLRNVDVLVELLLERVVRLRQSTSR